MAIFFLLDYAGESLLRSIYITVLTGCSGPGVVNGALSSRADIFILGSSSANHHYDPRIISNALDVSVYNAASDGAYYDYAYGLMILIGKKHTPKLWVMNVDDEKLLYDKRTAWRLAPRLNDDPIVKKLIFETLDRPIEKYRHVSRLMRFNQILAPLLKEKIFPEKNYAGFTPLEGKLPPKEKKTKNTNRDSDNIPEIKTVHFDMLSNIITLARQSGSDIIFVIGPRYYYDYSPDGYTPKLTRNLHKIYSDFAKKSNVIFIDHSATGIPAFYDKKYFRDHVHLNSAGSKIISEKLAEDIRTLIKSKKLNFFINDTRGY